MISVIIPIYNTEKYLSQCLDSVLNQSYKDIEILCINDCSPGNCLEILKRYQKKDSRVKFINNKKNKGVEVSRYIGLEIATGDYVMFIDSDDWLEGSNTIDIMLRKAEETNADYVEVSFQRVFDRFKLLTKKQKPFVTGILQQPALFDNYFISFFGNNILSVNACGKLYRMSTIKKVNPTPKGLTMGEDQAFNMQLFPSLKKIYIMDYVGYNYRYGGITSRYNKNLYPDLKKLYVWKIGMLKDRDYHKAFLYSNYEIKNVLCADICQRLRYKQGNEQDIIYWVRNELSQEIWKDIASSLALTKSKDKPFIKALIAGDATKMVQICKQMVYDDRWNYRVKLLLSKVFSIIG